MLGSPHCCCQPETCLNKKKQQAGPRHPKTCFSKLRWLLVIGYRDLRCLDAWQRFLEKDLVFHSSSCWRPKQNPSPAFLTPKWPVYLPSNSMEPGNNQNNSSNTTIHRLQAKQPLPPPNRPHLKDTAGKSPKSLCRRHSVLQDIEDTPRSPAALGQKRSPRTTPTPFLQIFGHRCSAGKSPSALAWMFRHCFLFIFL